MTIFLMVCLLEKKKELIIKKFNYEFIGVKEDFYGDWKLYKVNVIKYVNPYLYDLIEKNITRRCFSFRRTFLKKN